MSVPTVEHPKILIAEDEIVVALDLEQSLTGLGYDVVGVADTGRGAVRLVNEVRPHLVLMDIRLKGQMDGIEAAEEIRRRSQVPVVFVTAFTDEETLARARDAGPFGYVTKPFRTKELNATIMVALHQHRQAQLLFAECTWFTTLLASLSDGVIATDAHGCVRFLNPTAEALTGWTSSEAHDCAVEDVYRMAPSTGPPMGESHIRKALTSAAPTGKQRFLLWARTGHETPIEDSVAPIIESGRVVGAVAVFLDISDSLRAERKRAEQKESLEQHVRVTVEALGHTRAELLALSGRLISVQEEERARVARELHDDLAQRAALAQLEAERIEPLLVHLPGEAQESVRRIRAHIGEIVTGLSTVARSLYPPALRDLGLIVALRALVDEYRRQGVNARFFAQDAVSEIPQHTATALYRIAQEALRNAHRHAPGAAVSVSVARVNGELRLSVEDSGPGFNLDHVRGRGGLGLLSMQERARLVGGNLLLRTQPGKGTLLVVRISLKVDDAPRPLVATEISSHKDSHFLKDGREWLSRSSEPPHK